MALFTRTATTAPAPRVTAEVGRSPARNYMIYTTSSSRSACIALPTISRARDLLASLIGAAEIRHYGEQWTGEVSERVPLPPESWMLRPDPAVTRNYILGWTFDDLFFFGRAFWLITERYATGYPAAFTWLPFAGVSTPDQSGPTWFGPSPQIVFGGRTYASSDVVQFISPLQGLVYFAARAVRISIALDNAAERFAVNEVPAGWLQQTSGEPMSGDELADLATAFAAARADNAVAALNEAVSWHESSHDPSKLQLVEARQYQALELARAANVPAFLVGAPTTSFTYQNAEQARSDLVTFGARPFIDCIEQTLSGPQVTPRGRHVELGLDPWLRNPFGPTEPSTPVTGGVR